MESLSENRPLMWSIFLSGFAIVGLLTGSSPEFNEQFALVEIPTEVSTLPLCVGFEKCDYVKAVHVLIIQLNIESLAFGCVPDSSRW